MNITHYSEIDFGQDINGQFISIHDAYLTSENSLFLIGTMQDEEDFEADKLKTFVSRYDAADVPNELSQGNARYDAADVPNELSQRNGAAIKRNIKEFVKSHVEKEDVGTEVPSLSGRAFSGMETLERELREELTAGRLSKDAVLSSQGATVHEPRTYDEMSDAERDSYAHDRLKDHGYNDEQAIKIVERLGPDNIVHILDRQKLQDRTGNVSNVSTNDATESSKTHKANIEDLDALAKRTTDMSMNEIAGPPEGDTAGKGQPGEIGVSFGHKPAVDTYSP